MTSSKHNQTTKPLKWTTQKVNQVKSSSSRRVTKRTSSNSATQQQQVKKLTAGIQSDTRKEIARLENELEFTYDTVATITVHFESLYHAYTSSKSELDRTRSETRLGEMEKELLTAYDDLGLQVTHLERKIAKLEKRLHTLRELETPAPSLVQDVINSPCSSIDSSVLDFQVDAAIDWTLSPIMYNTNFLPVMNECDYYQELYCNTMYDPQEIYPSYLYM